MKFTARYRSRLGKYALRMWQLGCLRDVYKRRYEYFQRKKSKRSLMDAEWWASKEQAERRLEAVTRRLRVLKEEFLPRVEAAKKLLDLQTADLRLLQRFLSECTVAGGRSRSRPFRLCFGRWLTLNGSNWERSAKAVRKLCRQAGVASSEKYFEGVSLLPASCLLLGYWFASDGRVLADFEPTYTVPAPAPPPSLGPNPLELDASCSAYDAEMAGVESYPFHRSQLVEAGFIAYDWATGEAAGVVPAAQVPLPFASYLASGGKPTLRAYAFACAEAKARPENFYAVRAALRQLKE